MESVQPVAVEPATASDAVVLSNLLELYVHDLSDVFPHVEMGPDGRFGYDRLPLYWSEPDRRSAFLIRCDGRIAGFALVTRGSPAALDPSVLDVAEFFVLRRYRRSGVGRRAAVGVWTALPGKWTVRVAEGNTGALAFWRSVVDEFSRGTAAESSVRGQPHAWRVYSFDSPGAGA